MDVLDIANAVIKTVDVREQSYDKDAAYKATVEYEKKRKECENVDQNKTVCLMPNYGKFYKKTLEEASEEACKELDIDTRLSRLIYLAVDGWWNDSIEWAETIRKEEEWAESK